MLYGVVSVAGFMASLLFINVNVKNANVVHSAHALILDSR